MKKKSNSSVLSGPVQDRDGTTRVATEKLKSIHITPEQIQGAVSLSLSVRDVCRCVVDLVRTG